MGKKGCLISVQNPIEIKIKVQTTIAFLTLQMITYSVLSAKTQWIVILANFLQRIQTFTASTQNCKSL